MVLGLGFVLSFGYWCTDFLVVQRAMAAKNLAAAQRTPLIAAVPKLLLPLLVIVPGMLAVIVPAPPPSPLLPGHGVMDGSLFPLSGVIPPKLDEVTGELLRDALTGRVILDYDLATPMLMARYFPPGLLGLGLLALLASFMSGMAGNTTAFNTVFTYDIYQSYLNKSASDKKLLWMGRMSTVVGILLSIATAYVARSFNNIMDLLQLVFAFINAPLFATFMLGMFWKRATAAGAFYGLLSGTLAAALHHGMTLPLGVARGLKGGFLLVVHSYRSEMAQNFWTAIYAWTCCFVVTIGVSLFTKAQPEESLRGLVYSLTPKPEEEALPFYRRPALLAVYVLLATLVLNIIFY